MKTMTQDSAHASVVSVEQLAERATQTAPGQTEPTKTETRAPSTAPLRHRAARAAIKPRGLGRIYRRGTVWWVDYWHHGCQFRESSQRARQVDAERLLKRRIQQIGRGR